MGKKILCFTFMFLWIMEVFAQNSAPNPAEYNRKNYKKALAVWQIGELKSGLLLVRLSTKETSIRALRQAGLEEKADKLEKEQKLLNASIIQGFKTSFDFCDVYFFESSYSENVSEGQLGQINFVDSLIPSGENKPKLGASPIFVAEFTSLEPDTVGSSKARGGHTQTAPKSNLGISALVIKSDQFIQLMKPFPYYVRAYKDMSELERQPATVMRLMNRNLNNFYNKRDNIKIKKKRKKKSK